LVRGVNSDGVVNHLLSKGLIKIIGRKNVPGRPYIYGTTKLFLEYFGLKSLRDLPKLEDIQSLDIGTEEQDILPAEDGPQETPAVETESAAPAEEETAAVVSEELQELGEPRKPEEADVSVEEAAPESVGAGETKEEDPEELKHAIEEISRDDRPLDEETVEPTAMEDLPAENMSQDSAEDAEKEPAILGDDNRTV